MYSNRLSGLAPVKEESSHSIPGFTMVPLACAMGGCFPVQALYQMAYEQAQQAQPKPQRDLFAVMN